MERVEQVAQEHEGGSGFILHVYEQKLLEQVEQESDKGNYCILYYRQIYTYNVRSISAHRSFFPVPPVPTTDKTRSVEQGKFPQEIEAVFEPRPGKVKSL